MKIELKNIYVSERLSEETTAFDANLYINGVKAGRAKNDGHGGPTSYYSTGDKGQQLISEAETWCKTLPPLAIDGIEKGDKPFSVPMTLEHYIDDLLSKHLEQKEQQRFQKQMERDMQTGIVFGVSNNEYRGIKFKFPLSEILKYPKGIEALKKAIEEKVLPELKKGEKILNTNLPEEFIKLLNIDKDKIVSSSEVLSRKQIKREQDQYPTKSNKPRR